MDMNRKIRFGLKNKNSQMAASIVQKFVLILALFVMMAATAHAEPFLNDNFTTDDGVVVSPVTITINSVEEDIPVINRRRTDDLNDDNDIYDTWGTTPSGYTGYTSSDNDYEGYYIGTFSDDNDSAEGLVELIEYFLDEDISQYTFLKVDEPDNTNTTSNTDLTLTVNYDNSGTSGEYYSGDWTITGGADEDANKINFYSVKGSTEYALYYVDPAKSSGTWTTAHLENNGGNMPGISHLSVLKTSTTNENHVPEPATMLLFGFSLMGLAGMARRRNSKF